MSDISSTTNIKTKELKNSYLFEKIKDYISLLKPRVMSLSIFTSLVGMYIAPGGISMQTSLLVLLSISIGSGASGALNMWYEIDTDKLMERTKGRALPQGKIKPIFALFYGSFLAVISVFLLYYVSNLLAASLLALTIFFYIFIYTIWLKKRSPQNIVIGGAAGAFPPMIGWTSVTGTISLEIILIFMIIFIWTPPHFWALALYKSDDYKRAGIPMMPLIVGNKRTINMIIFYSILLMPTALLLGLYYSLFYFISALVLSSVFIYLAFSLKKNTDDIAILEKKAQALFFFSILYLFNIFSIILIDNLIWS